MNEPRRLLDGALGPLGRQVLESADADEPSAERVNRWRSQLGLPVVGAASGLLVATATKAAAAPQLAVTAGAATANAAAGASTKVLSQAALLVIGKWTALVALPIAVGATLLEVRSQKAHSVSAPSAAPPTNPRAEPKPRDSFRSAAPSSVTPSSSAAPSSAEAAHDTPTVRALPSHRIANAGGDKPGSSTPSGALGRGAPSASPAAASTEQELAALDAARRALQRGNPALALIELDRHAQAFPGGALSPEASVLRIVALSQTGRASEAQRLGRQFLERHPGSPLAAKVRAIIEPKPQP